MTALGIGFLLRQDRIAPPGLAGVEQQHAPFKVLKGIAGDLQCFHGDITVVTDLEAVEATPDCNVLILLAHWMASEFDLYPARQFSQLPLRTVLAGQGVESDEQRNQVGSGAAHSSAGGHVRHRSYLDVAGYLELSQRVPYQIVFKVVHELNLFGLRVLDSYEVIRGGAIDRHMHVLVYGRAKEESAKPGVIRRQIRATTTKGNSQWRSCKDHLEDTSPSAWMVSAARAYTSLTIFITASPAVAPTSGALFPSIDATKSRQ